MGLDKYFFKFDFIAKKDTIFINIRQIRHVHIQIKIILVLIIHSYSQVLPMQRIDFSL